MVRAKVSGVELIVVVAMGVIAGASAFAWTAGAPGVGLAADAERATTTLVDNRAATATPVANDEIALRIKTSPWAEVNGRVAHERRIRV